MAVAHVQTLKAHFHGSELTPATASMTFAAGGPLAIVTVLTYDTTTTVAPSSVKLDATTSFAKALDSGDFASGSDHVRITIWYLENIASGAHTATATYASVFVSTLFITEVSGAATSSAADGAGTFASGSTTTPASGSFTAANTDDFWWSAVTSAVWVNPATFTAGTGWTIPTPTSGSEETDSSQWLCGAVEYIQNPGTASENGQWTTKSGLNIATVSAFKVAGGGGGVVVKKLAALGVG